MSLIGNLYVTRMSSVCHPYVLVCHPDVTCMYSYITCMSLMCTGISSYVSQMYSYETRDIWKTGAWFLKPFGESVE